MSDFITPGETLLCGGKPRVVAKWQADWSLALPRIPHVLFILWEGESKYDRFTSDATGTFAEIDRP